MASEPPQDDILGQYQHISNKLKKRFLRKPNVSEAGEGYTALANRCESLEMPAYAGMCWISAARCEGTINNIPGETANLVKAARQFLHAEEHDFKLGCPSPNQENLSAGVGCFAYASTRYPEDSLIPVSLDLELVEFLKRINKTEDIEENLLHAIELCRDNLDVKTHCLTLLALHYNSVKDFTSALNKWTEIVALVEKLPLNGARADILLKCELNRVFLLLILRPAAQKLAPDLTKILAKYMWGDHDSNLQAWGMSEKMFILLQSLVASCQSSDASNLTDLENDLWFLIGKEERDLLRALVRIYIENC